MGYFLSSMNETCKIGRIGLQHLNLNISMDERYIVSLNKTWNQTKAIPFLLTTQHTHTHTQYTLLNQTELTFEVNEK